MYHPLRIGSLAPPWPLVAGYRCYWSYVHKPSTDSCLPWCLCSEEYFWISILKVWWKFISPQWSVFPRYSTTCINYYLSPSTIVWHFLLCTQLFILWTCGLVFLNQGPIDTCGSSSFHLWFSLHSQTCFCSCNLCLWQVLRQVHGRYLSLAFAGNYSRPCAASRIARVHTACPGSCLCPCWPWSSCRRVWWRAGSRWRPALQRASSTLRSRSHRASSCVCWAPSPVIWCSLPLRICIWFAVQLYKMQDCLHRLWTMFQAFEVNLPMIN